MAGDPVSALLDDFSVTISLPVEWGHMDAFNHVNNVAYFRFFESARIAYFEKAGIMTYMQTHGVGPILKHTQCRFRIPLTYPDTVDVGARVGEIGDNQFEMLYRVVSRKSAGIAADGTGTIVCVDYQSSAKVDIPAPLKEAIARLETTTAPD